MVALSARFSYFIASCLLVVVRALILLEDIGQLTHMTRAAISWSHGSIVEDDHRLAQQPLILTQASTWTVSFPWRDSTEPLKHVEDAVVAISQLNTALASRLSVPMRNIDFTNPSCSIITASYVDFLTQTTRLLVLLMERKPNPFQQSHAPSDKEHDLFQQIGWMQRLWASRTAPGNTHMLSFIEQRQALYKATNCFGNMREVLRRDVEVVELLNDLLDAYRPESQ